MQVLDLMVIIMNRMRLISILGVLGIAMMNPVSAFAHVALTDSMPKADSTVNAAPESLMLMFTEEVKLLKAAIAPEGGKEMDIGFKPMSMAMKHFNVALPSLSEGVYQVNWTVMGSDGHRMDESFSFTIDANAMSTDHDANHTNHGGSHDNHSDGNH